MLLNAFQRLRGVPIMGAAVAQILAALVSAAGLWLLAGRIEPAFALWVALAIQCLAAVSLTLAIRLPVWWVWIGLLFPLSIALALNAGSLPAWPFGVAFVVFYLVFSNTARERVPLYLTNRRTAAALDRLMRQRGAQRMIDLGSGLGGVVRALDGEGRVARGVETAPIVWLISMVLSKLTGRGTILLQDIWSTPLKDEDVVYAFLSPEPMPALYRKAIAEMKAGSLLVSNSFAVPGVDADEIWELDDRRHTRLYLYGINGRSTKAG